MGEVLMQPMGGGVGSDDVTAGKAQVLSGYNTVTKESDDEVVAGSMPNNAAWSASTSGSGSVTIPAGYHNGSGTVSGSASYNQGVSDADGRVNTSSASYNSGYTNGVSSGKGTNATVTISGAAGGAGGVYFSINLTVNSNGTVHVNSITRTGSGGNPYDFDGVRMGFTITGTDGSSVIARD